MSDHTGGWATPEQPGDGDDDRRSDAGAPPPPSPTGPMAPPPGSSLPPPSGWGDAPGADAPPPPPAWPGAGGWQQAAPPRQRLGLIPMYPMGVGDILDTAFKLLRTAAGPSVLIVLVILGPVQLIASLAFGDPSAILREPVPAEPDAGMVALSLVGSVLQLVTAPLATAALTWLAARTDEGRPPTFGAALGAGLRRLLPVLGAMLLLVLTGGLLIAVLVLALVLAGSAGGVAAGVLVGIPSVAVMVATGVLLLAAGYMVVPVIMVEELGPIRALRRLWRLVRPQFWRVLGISVLTGIVFTLLGGAVSTIFSILAFLPTGVGWVFIAIGSILDQMIRVPLGAFAALALYVDLRIRGEGYDIAVLAGELRR